MFLALLFGMANIEVGFSSCLERWDWERLLYFGGKETPMLDAMCFRKTE